MKSEINKPELKIRYAQLLDPFILGYLKDRDGWKEWTPPSKERILESIAKYKAWWEKDAEKVFEAMFEAMNLEFKRTVIDIYVVSGINRQMSDPVILKSCLKEDYFISTIVHELTHLLFMQNNDKFSHKLIMEEYPEESKTTVDHIYTFAFLKYLLNDILKLEGALERTINLAKETGNNTDYLKAWKIVEKIGYKKLLDEIKNKRFSM